MAIEECRSCRFSKALRLGLVCRRYPPLDTEGRFPATDPFDWCGEWMAMRPGAGLPAEIKPPKPTPSPGRAAGGHARAAALSPERRVEIAQNAARSRWNTP